MDKDKFRELLKKCFGKEKNDKYHAVAMLMLYGIFFIFVFIFINAIPKKDLEKPEPTPTSTPSISSNYSYRYIVKYDDDMYEISGRKLDNKETFTYVKGDITTNYSVINNSLYLDKDGNYEKTSEFDSNYKYLNREKILGLIDYSKCINNDINDICDIDSKSLSTTFNDKLTTENDITNPVFIIKKDNNIKSITLELDNYISNVTGESHTLTITMDFSEEGNK